MDCFVWQDSADFSCQKRQPMPKKKSCSRAAALQNCPQDYPFRILTESIPAVKEFVGSASNLFKNVPFLGAIKMFPRWDGKGSAQWAREFLEQPGEYSTPAPTAR
jgi:hypothetical protein